MMNEGLPKGFDDFRNKTIFQFDPQNISRITYRNPDDNVHQILAFNQKDWLVTNAIKDTSSLELAPLDSNKITSYLSDLQLLSGKSFAYDFDEVNSEDFFSRQLTLFDQRNLDSIIINCYQYEKSPSYIIHSSQNQDAFFLSDSTGVFQNIFLNLATLLE